MAYPDWLVDKRVVDRNIKKGMVDSKELDKQIKGLPDRADNAEVIQAALHSWEGADDEESFDEDD